MTWACLGPVLGLSGAVLGRSWAVWRESGVVSSRLDLSGGCLGLGFSLEIPEILKTLKNQWFFKAFGISGFSKEQQKPRQPRDRPRQAKMGPRQPQTGPRLPKTGPRQPQTGPRQAQEKNKNTQTKKTHTQTKNRKTHAKHQNKKNMFLFEVFGISGISKENPRQRQPPDKSRDAKTAEDRPK